MKSITTVIGIIVLSMGTAQKAAAQYDYENDLYYDNKVTYEIGGSIGAMNCLTDLGGGKGTGKRFIKDLNVGKTQFTGSIFLSAAYRYAFVLRAEATWGVIKADDKVLEGVKETTLGRYDRNLSFRSTVYEVMLAAEIHPRFFRKYDKKEKLPRFSPYLMGGIGYFSFNPKAKLNDQWIELQPLSTEGQGFAEYPNRKEYRLKQLNFPVGAGFKYKLSPLFNFSAECIYRVLNTDYLDDVSTRYIDQKVFSNHFTGDQLTNVLLLNDRQKELNSSHVPLKDDIRGNPDNNDAYFTINFKLAYVF
jgi:opacity protein-like surface antigen